MLCIIACQRDDACMGQQRLRRWLMKACDADIKITPWDRNSWKWKAWSLGEQIGWELWELTTRQYFRYSCCGLLVSEATSVIPFKLPEALENRSDGRCWSSRPGSTSGQTAVKSDLTPVRDIATFCAGTSGACRKINCPTHARLRWMGWMERRSSGRSPSRHWMRHMCP